MWPTIARFAVKIVPWLAGAFVAEQATQFIPDSGNPKAETDAKGQAVNPVATQIAQTIPNNPVSTGWKMYVPMWVRRTLISAVLLYIAFWAMIKYRPKLKSKILPKS